MTARRSGVLGVLVTEVSPGLRSLDADALGVRRQGAQVAGIRGEHGATRFGEGDDQRVDRRSLPGGGPQGGCPAGEGERP